MSGNNGNCANGVQPTKELVINYSEKTGIEIAIADSKINATKKTYEAQILARNFLICCQQKALIAKTYYSNIDNCVVTTGVKDAELLKAKIAEYIKLGDDLSKKMQDTSKTVKNMKMSMAKVSCIALSLEECLKEEKRCNPTRFKEMEDGIGAQALKDFITGVKDMSASLLSEANICFDAMIDNCGIVKFINASSFKDFSDPLAVEMNKLKDNLATNLKEISKNEADAQTRLTKTLQELSKVKFGYFATEVEKKGLECINEELCEFIDNYDELANPNSSKNPCPKTPEENAADLHANCIKFLNCQVPGSPSPPVVTKTSHYK